MLKELFFKHKPDTDELLPPPPPFPSMEIEGDAEAAKPAASGKGAGEGPDTEFNDLLKDLEDSSSPKTPFQKEKTRINSLKLKTKLSKFKKTAAKSKISPAEAKKTEAELEDMDMDFNLPEDIEQASENDAISGSFERFNINDEDLKKPRPKEIAEAEDEIKSAIEKIKVHENKSLIGSLFRRKAQEPRTKSESGIIPEDEDSMSRIKGKIESVRDSLANFDLEAARKDYIEIMEIYSKMPPEEQAKVYYEIKNIYYERKSAEGLKY